MNNVEALQIIDKFGIESTILGGKVFKPSKVWSSVYENNPKLRQAVVVLANAIASEDSVTIGKFKLTAGSSKKDNQLYFHWSDTDNKPITNEEISLLKSLGVDFDYGKDSSNDDVTF
jgi:hypothetical protein